MLIFKNARFSTQLVLLLALPLIAMFWFAQPTLLESYFNITLALMIFAVTAFFGWHMIRKNSYNLGADPVTLRKTLDGIANFQLEQEFHLKGENITGVYAAAEKLQDNLKDYMHDSERKIVTTSRTQKALDRAGTCMTISDRARKVAYLNPAAKQLFVRLQDDIRERIKGFSVDDISKYSIQDFLVFCEEQKTFDAQDESEQLRMLRIGSYTIKLALNPVISDEGEFWGIVAEWTDRTQEIKSRTEIQQVVDSALNGDLGQRVNIEELEGYYKALAGSVNNLVENFELVIGDTNTVLNALASGDLSKKIKAEYKGELQSLKVATNSTISKLTEVVTEIKIVSDQVKSGAREISDGNTNLSNRTEDQAGSLERTATSMEAMTNTVKRNAANATEANRLVLETRQQAEAGGEVVSMAVSAMQEIDDSSKKISDIIGVIDEIAFQTNLLALNASVEAARAGEQGRGFSVVASEVRNLAGRSATAAKEIKDLIEDSSAKVGEGSRLVNESGDTLREIISGVKQVTEIVGEIASASQDQSEGINEVNATIVTMDDLTQQNASLVEHAAEASETLGQQASRLNDMMDFFATDENNRATRDTNRTAHPAVKPSADRRQAARPWVNKPAPKKSVKREKVSPEAVITIDSGMVGNGETWDEF